MKAMVLHGSPRKGKNSDTLADNFIRGLKEAENYTITHFYINELSITPCQGCLLCSNPPHICGIQDDMQTIYKAYKESNLIVWISPMYRGYLTAQLKLVQDRMEALAWRDFGNKTFTVLITYRHHYQSTVSMFERIAPYFDIDLHIVACQTYNPKTKLDIPIEELPGKLEKAYLLGRKLGKT